MSAGNLNLNFSIHDIQNQPIVYRNCKMRFDTAHALANHVKKVS